MTSTASRALLDVAEQVACMAAQVGTATALGGELGVSDGLGDGEGLGERLGVALAGSNGVGLVLTAVPTEPQPVSANSTARAPTPCLIGN